MRTLARLCKYPPTNRKCHAKRSLHRVKNMMTTNLSKYGQGIQGLFVNIKWRTEQNPHGYTVKEF